MPSGPIAPAYVENSWAMTPVTGAGWAHSSGVGGAAAVTAAGAGSVRVCAATIRDCRATVHARSPARSCARDGRFTAATIAAMTWATYGTFVAFAAIVVIAPGPDFAVVLKNSLRGGRGGGYLTSLGVTSSCVVQGTLAAFGVGVVIARSQSLFLGIRVAGVAYLLYLGIQALLAARRGDSWAVPALPGAQRARRWAAFRQGFLSNITNPKVLAFYLSVLPQFLSHAAGTPVIDALALAYTHAALGVVWLFALVTFLHRVRPVIQRRRVRRALDAATGTALVGFASVLAVESR